MAVTLAWIATSLAYGDNPHFIFLKNVAAVEQHTAAEQQQKKSGEYSAFRKGKEGFWRRCWEYRDFPIRVPFGFLPQVWLLWELSFSVIVYKFLKSGGPGGTGK